MDFMSGERDEKRRKKDQQRKDSIWKANFDSICIGLHQIFPDISAATFKSHLRKGREMKSRNYNILPNRNRRISYIQYKEAKRLPVFKMSCMPTSRVDMMSQPSTGGRSTIFRYLFITF